MRPLTGPADVVIRRVAAGVTATLRADVLRPGLGVAAVVKPDDDHPDTAFFAAVTRGGHVLSTVNVRPRSPPWEPGSRAWWQLRGMATAAEARGQGYATGVLQAALVHVDAAGGHVWCHARSAALDLYQRTGFVPVGEAWVHPERGPHQTLRRPGAG